MPLLPLNSGEDTTIASSPPPSQSPRTVAPEALHGAASAMLGARLAATNQNPRTHQRKRIDIIVLLRAPTGLVRAPRAPPTSARGARALCAPMACRTSRL